MGICPVPLGKILAELEQNGYVGHCDHADGRCVIYEGIVSYETALAKLDLAMGKG